MTFHSMAMLQNLLNQILAPAVTGEGFDPEEGTAYELGFKWQALDNMLSIDSAIFTLIKKMS